MPPPHWLDDVIGELRDVDDIALAIAESPSFGRRFRRESKRPFSGRPCTNKTPSGLPAASSRKSASPSSRR
jgi:hypothetical protein